MNQLQNLKINQLKKLLKDKCVPIPSCGSGKNKQVLKKDIINALNKAGAKKTPMKKTPRKKAPKKKTPRKKAPKKKAPKKKGLNQLTINQLKQRIKKAGLRIPLKGEGSGKNKAVLKKDLVVVLRKKKSPVRKIQKSHLELLPKDILHITLLNMDTKDVLTLCSVNKNIQKSCNEVFWRKYTKKHFPNIETKGKYKTWREKVKSLYYVPKYGKYDLQDIGERVRRGIITVEQARIEVSEEWPKTTFEGEELFEHEALMNTRDYFEIRGDNDIDLNEVIGYYDIKEDEVIFDLTINPNVNYEDYDNDSAFEEDYYVDLSYLDGPDYIVFFQK